MATTNIENQVKTQPTSSAGPHHVNHGIGMNCPMSSNIEGVSRPERHMRREHEDQPTANRVQKSHRPDLPSFPDTDEERVINNMWIILLA